MTYSETELAFMAEAVHSITGFLISDSCTPDQAMNIVANVFWRINYQNTRRLTTDELLEKLRAVLDGLDSIAEETHAIN